MSLRMHRVGACLSAMVLLVALAGCSGSSDAPPSTSSARDTSKAGEQSAEPSAPVEQPFELQSAAVTTEFSDQAGYSAQLTTTLWDTVPADATWPLHHPARASVVLDRPADLRPDVDAVIPFQLTITSTTSGFDLESPRVSWTLENDFKKAGLTKQARALECWSWFGSGWETVTWDIGRAERGQGVGEIAGFNYDVVSQSIDTGWGSVTWNQPLQPGASVDHVGFLIYRDEQSPAEPEGAKWVLDHLSLRAYTLNEVSGEGGPRLSLSGEPWTKQ